MIKLENINYSYVKDEKLLNNIDLIINNGDSIGIVGDNGSGKSTLIKIMLSIITPISGTVYYDGENIHKKRSLLMKKIGVVWGQRTSLWWDLSIKESFYQIGEIFDIDIDILEKNINYYSNILPIKSFWNKLLRKVSNGQRVQADIISVLIREPKIIFLDEAFIGLDYDTKSSIIKILKDYRNLHPDTIYIITSHAFDDLTSLCDKLIVLKKNHTIQEYDTNSLLNYKSSEIIIETKEPVTMQFDNTIYKQLNPYKFSIIVKGSLNAILKEINWDNVLKIEINDRTIDTLLKAIL